MTITEHDVRHAYKALHRYLRCVPRPWGYGLLCPRKLPAASSADLTWWATLASRAAVAAPLPVDARTYAYYSLWAVALKLNGLHPKFRGGVAWDAVGWAPLMRLSAHLRAHHDGTLDAVMRRFRDRFWKPDIAQRFPYFGSFRAAAIGWAVRHRAVLSVHRHHGALVEGLSTLTPSGRRRSPGERVRWHALFLLTGPRLEVPEPWLDMKPAVVRLLRPRTLRWYLRSYVPIVGVQPAVAVEAITQRLAGRQCHDLLVRWTRTHSTIGPETLDELADLDAVSP